MKNDKKIFFFFPYYHTGGAEKAHLQIVKCFAGYNCRIFFTDRSRDNRNKKEFYKNAKCFNFFGINNKINLVEKFLAFCLARIINKTKGVVVFGSNSRFFYSLIKKLNKEVKVVDLVHWLDGEMGSIIIKNSSSVDKRVVVTRAIFPLLEDAYKEAKVDREQIDKVHVIENFVSINENLEKEYDRKLHVIYVGRNTYEKRAQLAFQVERKLRINKNLNFTFVGRGLKNLAGKLRSDAEVIELIKCEAEMSELYKKSHIIILTSLFEGFPCVIMEAMSFGVVPVVTAVGGLPIHLQDKRNSLLINNEDEEKIVSNIAGCILQLEKDRHFLKLLSQSSFQYAQKNFFKGDFCQKYKKLIET